VGHLQRQLPGRGAKGHVDAETKRNDFPCRREKSRETGKILAGLARRKGDLHRHFASFDGLKDEGELYWHRRRAGFDGEKTFLMLSLSKHANWRSSCNNSGRSQGNSERLWRGAKKTCTGIDVDAEKTSVMLSLSKHAIWCPRDRRSQGKFGREKGSKTQSQGKSGVEIL
jgi:hypothetical protein